MKLPSLDNVQAIALGLGVGLLAYAGWKLYAGAKELAAAVPDAVDQVDQWAAGNQYVAPLADHFDASHWRPAGVYLGSVLMFATGGTELKPEYRTENGGPGY